MSGLRQKLILSHVGLVALAMALAGLYVLQQMEQFYVDNMMVNLEARAVVTASYLRSELSTNRLDLLQSALRDRDPRHATSVRVMDARGHLVGSSEPEDAGELGTAVQDAAVTAVLNGAPAVAIHRQTSPRGAVSVAIAPITDHGQIIGAVRLAYQLAVIEAEIAELSRNLALGLLVAGAGCAAFAGFLAASLAAPMQRLAAAAHAVARGDLGQRARLRGSDEVAQAGAAFDSLAESLQTLEVSRREVMSEVSHDLHGLATGLSAAAEALQRGALDDPDLAPLLLQGIAARTRQISRLADDLLQTTRFETGRLMLEPRPTSPAALIEQTAAEFALQAAERGVTVELQAGEPHALVAVDAERLLQALANLMENSLRHTPHGGAITLAARLDGGWLHLTVADTGSGVPRDEAARMFGRFYRPSGGQPGRLGLGLGIVRGIAEAHGGRVEVESGHGGGAMFTLIIPAAAITPAFTLDAAPAH